VVRTHEHFIQYVQRVLDTVVAYYHAFVHACISGMRAKGSTSTASGSLAQQEGAGAAEGAGGGGETLEGSREQAVLGRAHLPEESHYMMRPSSLFPSLFPCYFSSSLHRDSAPITSNLQDFAASNSQDFASSSSSSSALPTSLPLYGPMSGALPQWLCNAPAVLRTRRLWYFVAFILGVVLI